MNIGRMEHFKVDELLEMWIHSRTPSIMPPKQLIPAAKKEKKGSNFFLPVDPKGHQMRAKIPRRISIGSFRAPQPIDGGAKGGGSDLGTLRQ